jgi:hypothetical protein
MHHYYQSSHLLSKRTSIASHLIIFQVLGCTSILSSVFGLVLPLNVQFPFPDFLVLRLFFGLLVLFFILQRGFTLFCHFKILEVEFCQVVLNFVS